MQRQPWQTSKNNCRIDADRANRSWIMILGSPQWLIINDYRNDSWWSQVGTNMIFAGARLTPKWFLLVPLRVEFARLQNWIVRIPHPPTKPPTHQEPSLIGFAPKLIICCGIICLGVTRFLIIYIYIHIVFIQFIGVATLKSTPIHPNPPHPTPLNKQCAIAGQSWAQACAIRFVVFVLGLCLLNVNE